MEKSETSNKINWKMLIIPIIVTAILSLAVAVVAPMIVNYVNTPQLKLQFYSQDTLPFKASEIQIASYQIVIKNDGSKALDNIICQVSLSGAKIDQYTFSPSAPFTYSQENTTNKVTIKIDNLNPRESGTIYILGTSESQLPNQPEIQLRADGVTGEEAVSTNNVLSTPWYETAIMVMAVSFMALASGLVTFRRVANRSAKYTDQNDCLGYLCGNHGVYSEMDRYYDKSEVLFRNEADRLTAIAVKNPEERKKIQAVLLDLLGYADHVSPVSKGIIFFNLAKIAKLMGDQTQQNQYLEDAKKYAKDTVEARLKIDQILKT
ncbi:MAG: hypothetical protein NWE92_01240 [Candidatus Bathyarchaeota archaeon]|nr:hypothetical protein [Candidatus Bathyarchaeota archaeon]